MPEATTAAAGKKSAFTLKDVGKLDELKKSGFRWEKLGSGFSAYRKVKGSDEVQRIGPAKTADALFTLVTLELDKEKGNGKEGHLPADPHAEATDDHPDGYLFEEMKPKGQTVVPELRNPILNYQGFKEERIAVLAKEVEAKKEVDRLMHANEDKLAVDPSTGIKSYRVNDIIVELVPGEDKLKTHRATDEDDE